jgi:hypothetical protein
VPSAFINAVLPWEVKKKRAGRAERVRDAEFDERHEALASTGASAAAVRNRRRLSLDSI